MVKVNSLLFYLSFIVTSWTCHLSSRHERMNSALQSRDTELVVCVATRFLSFSYGNVRIANKHLTTVIKKFRPLHSSHYTVSFKKLFWRQDEFRCLARDARKFWRFRCYLSNSFNRQSITDDDVMDVEVCGCDGKRQVNESLTVVQRRRWHLVV